MSAIHLKLLLLLFQAHALQQAGVTNPALLPILQNLSNVVSASNNSMAAHSDITQQLAAAMMLPTNHLTAQQQLQSALLNVGQSPLIACKYSCSKTQ